MAPLYKFLVIISVLLLASCATVTQDIEVDAHADPKASFSGYKTFSWLASAQIVYDPQGQWEPPNMDIDSEVRFIVNRELRNLGMTEVSANPDVFVAFAAGVDMTSLDLKEHPESKEQHLVNIPKAALIVVLVDADTGFIIWLGEASGDADSSRSIEEIHTRVDYAVKQMFKRIPNN